MTDTQITRRFLGRTAAFLAAAGSLPFTSEHALAQLSMIGPLPPDAVKINANENPMGPCAAAVDAIAGVVRGGGRYMYEETFTFGQILAEQEGVKADHVRPFPGSSEPLHRSVLAFTSPTKSFVTADPGYEAGQRAATVSGAKVVRVPLTSAHAHDVKAMATADPNAGLIYICNPNNPTGTLTSRSDLEWLVANKPAESVVLIDEAYIHFSSSGQVCTDMVAAGKDVIILRTFSKLYGMAGLRAGAAIARPDILAKISQYGAGALPVTGMVGAAASLRSKTLVAERRKIVADIRNDVFAFLDKKGMTFVPSESNKFMLDVKRPGQEIVRAMAAEKVFIGRVWSAWPTHVRVSIGTKEEMAKFKTAIVKVMQA